MNIIATKVWWLPIAMVPDRRFALITVLTKGQREDYAAYQAIMPDNPSMIGGGKERPELIDERWKVVHEWTANSGEKLNELQARAMFPELALPEYSIKAKVSCSQCNAADAGNNLEAGLTEYGIQVWCALHNVNIVHLKFIKPRLRGVK